MALGIFLLALMTAAGAAQAAGIDVGWSMCIEDGVSNSKMFGCQTNSYTNTIVPSFQPPAGITSLGQVVVTFEVCVPSGTLPAWWDFFNPGSCRQSSVQWSAPVDGMCPSPWGSVPVTGSILSFGPDPGPYQYRLVAETHPVDGSGAAVDPEGVYEALRLVIDHANTKGDGACAGCVNPLALRLAQVELEMSDGSPSITLTTRRYNDMLYWNWTGLPDVECGHPVPARTSTWGSLKSLYR